MDTGADRRHGMLDERVTAAVDAAVTQRLGFRESIEALIDPKSYVPNDLLVNQAITNLKSIFRDTPIHRGMVVELVKAAVLGGKYVPAKPQFQESVTDSLNAEV